MSDLPKDYDVIVVGTGLTESILAAALSRIGKSVLHIDRNPYYGGEFSSHSLTGLIEWANGIVKSPNNNNDKIVSASNKDEENQNIELSSCNNDMNKYFFDVEHKFNENYKDDLLKKSRQFILDLSPNAFYSSGSLIELLISSDVARYSEFKMVSQILTRRQNGTLEKVPTSRAEVFKSSQLGMLEKRVMMQFVQSCLKENDFGDFFAASSDERAAMSMSYRQLIESKNVPESIAHYLINAVAMCSDESRSALDGLRSTRKFLKSVGRFGDSPFLYCMYGSGELSQCFCRLAAVFGAIYYLTLTIEKFCVNKQSNLIESIHARKLEDELLKFNCKHLVIDSSYAPNSYLENFSAANHISRCILITDKSIYVNPADPKGEHVSLLYLPKTQNSPAIYLFECSHTIHCSPNGYFVVYMFCLKSNKSKSSKEEFKEAIHALFRIQDDDCQGCTSDENEKAETPNVLFSFYFSHLNSQEFVEKHLPLSNMPENLHILSGSSANLDFEHQVEEAERIFRKICPTEQFLPRPPDPEDIIIDSVPTENLNDSGVDESKEQNAADVHENVKPKEDKQAAE